jgi:hypothetical protein
MFRSSLICTELAANIAGLTLALHLQEMRANEQSGYAPKSSRRRL